MTIVRKFFQLLGIEKRDIFYIYVYSFFMGLISLSLPLLIQSVINLVSSAQVTTSIVVLTALIIVMVLFNGGLQIAQLILVEFLQRRIFTKTALALANKIPRIKWESVFRDYPPELINRFFDVVNLQKGLSKLLTDFSVSIFQLFFGIVLLAIYHPLFLIYALTLTSIAIGYFRFTSPRGLTSSINESKAKYAVAHWLEEIGRTLKTFKLTGSLTYPMQKTDGLILNYLDFRSEHFKVLKQQYWGIIIFKMILISGLLILGSILVINQQINFGQFVAAEILIILILSAVEKALSNLDTIYDVLTSFEKVNSLTELDEEIIGEAKVKFSAYDDWEIDITNLCYKYPENKNLSIDHFSACLRKGESVAFSGDSTWGVKTFLKVLMGILDDYSGNVLINEIPLSNYNLDDLRFHTGDNLYHEHILHGSILENVLIGRKHIPQEDLLAAIELSGLDEFIKDFENGLNMLLVSGGINISDDAANAIILARALAGQPKILIINADKLGGNELSSKEILLRILEKKHPWTVFYFTRQRELEELADQKIYMNQTSPNQENKKIIS